MKKRTNIVLDEDLVREALRYAGGGSRRELVDRALREFVDSHKRRDVRELRGKVHLRPDYDHKRLREGLGDDEAGGDDPDTGNQGRSGQSVG